ncbi:hypothetical protein AK812_SmicGene44644 [Symbiodinium microadriaticum]|uniref:Uncharacterized protein n=1 Tax=Symbiodinium microadriaticum TaxID=2951 RepID=A0A1Q9BY86_SYMMI|nr:hypothetical protein AK812_SmicGene44644 [Symbiodinium microadriaticum]
MFINEPVSPEVVQRTFARLKPEDVHAMSLADRVQLAKLLRPLFKADASEGKACAVKKCKKTKDVHNLRDPRLVKAAGELGKMKRRNLPLEKGDPVCGACRCMFSREAWATAAQKRLVWVSVDLVTLIEMGVLMSTRDHRAECSLGKLGATSAAIAEFQHESALGEWLGQRQF